MVPVRLLLSCLLFGGLYLIAISLLLELFERKLHLRELVPKELREESGAVWLGMNIFMEGLFFVVIPSLAFGFFYLLLPVTGIRAGMASALFAFTIGAAPALMGLAVRIKLPMPFVLYSLVALLIKLGGTLIIIGYLYAQ